MNFIISSATLLKYLQSVSGALSSNNKLPMADNFLFEIDGNSLTISASDMETTMRTTLELTNSKDSGKVAIPSKLLLEVLKNLPDQPCTFEVDDETFSVSISYENGKSKMVGFNGEEYPKMPELEDRKSIRIPADVIINGVNTTLFATGNDDLRMAMTGVLCRFNPQAVVFVATDAHKLAHYKRTDIKSEEEFKFILPKKPLKLLVSNMSEDMDVLLEYNQSNAVFSFGDIVVICRLIDGTFPDWETVIPTNTSNTLTVDRLQLLSSIKRVSVFANKSSHRVGFKMQPDSPLDVSSEDKDYNNEASERLTCLYEGEERHTGYNGRFMLDMLSVLQTSNIRLELNEASRPAFIKPHENPNENEEIFMMIMPIAPPNGEYINNA